MLDLITKAGGGVLVNILQLAAGCLLAIPVYTLISSRKRNTSHNFMHDILLIIVSSILGLLLPVGPYGTIPITAAAITAGLKPYSVLPVVLSNLLFNSLVPFNDPGFIWKTGMNRVILAFLAAVLAGLLMRFFDQNQKYILNDENIAALGEKTAFNINMFSQFGNRIGAIAGYLIAGAVLNTLFWQLGFSRMISASYSNPATSFMIRFFSSQDVANPFFLLTMNIVYMLLDFSKLAAVMFIFKPKGILAFIVYYGAWAALLAAPAMIRL